MLKAIASNGIATSTGSTHISKGQIPLHLSAKHRITVHHAAVRFLTLSGTGPHGKGVAS